jgi:hypothetical protein
MTYRVIVVANPILMQHRILVVDDYVPAAAAITRLLRLCVRRP